MDCQVPRISCDSLYTLIEIAEDLCGGLTVEERIAVLSEVDVLSDIEFFMEARISINNGEELTLSDIEEAPEIVQELLGEKFQDRKEQVESWAEENIDNDERRDDYLASLNLTQLTVDTGDVS
ncbi:MAG: hypothetical protein R6V04_05725, partial [bacterium]